MKLREYEYMLAIAREANMTRAAQRLYVSQPALSKLLANVESELGAQLFRQEGRRMLPTAAGRIYLENAEKILSLNRDLERNVRLVSTRREISLAYPMIYSDFITGSILPAMRKHAASVSMRVMHIPQSRLLDHLLCGDVTFVFGIVTDLIRQSAAFVPIGHQEMVLAVSKGHPLEQQTVSRTDCTFPFLPAEALSDLPFLLSKDTSFSGRFATNYFHQHNIHPPVVLTSPVTAPLYRSVAMNGGVAFLPSIPLWHMNLEHELTYLSVEPCIQPYTVGLIFAKNHQLTEDEILLAEQMANLFNINPDTIHPQH